MTLRRHVPLPLVAAVVAALVAAMPWSTPAARAEADPVGVWPLVPEPPVVAGFDPPADPWGAGHRGVDLAGAVGQRVRAALPGRVSWAGVLAGRGVVVVDHGATRTTYEPVDAAVAAGDVVAAGDPIGVLALAGSHCVPRACLHWGWIESADTYLDPLRLVGAGTVRLLPLWRDSPLGVTSSAPLGRVTTPYARVLDMMGAWTRSSSTSPAGSAWRSCSVPTPWSPPVGCRAPD
ncbi:peptidoglycan DD-metalloendopeptidase family protein [Nocardioides sp. MAH-18]|uniref:Peptidoglycan DD-metalloendopeptidase family protein n=1 Tax=Nocardioides agri TaxID=2682843 RepID=A0A6L6XNA9_9ACTN|nr:MULTISPECIES: M23 family metallopeptidase [unclassified Nocardioides]MBA2953434.1 M23 family metallopeptidase [Nocardioides sp. CGMCC 1.13656]MVQ48302.1 peptidoglycan DD-metalloendopeptidase family protein [Nocardioides sp. MAH-18]